MIVVVMVTEESDLMKVSDESVQGEVPLDFTVRVVQSGSVTER